MLLAKGIFKKKIFNCRCNTLSNWIQTCDQIFEYDCDVINLFDDLLVKFNSDTKINYIMNDYYIINRSISNNLNALGAHLNITCYTRCLV